MLRIVGITLLACSLLLLGCGKSESASEPGPSTDGPVKTQIALNWVPEPEFGGIYAAQVQGAFAAHQLDVEILPGGAGAPTWQMVAAGRVPFAISSGDEVLIARSRGADVVALFTIFQTNPQGIMVHQERGCKQIADVFQGGTLAIEKGLAYAKYLEKKYTFDKVKLVPYDGGVAAFLADPNYAQQCFVTSEPLTARKQGAKVQTFLVADAGYNPYTAVLIARRDFVNQHRPVAQAMVTALREGWQAYLKDPKPANTLMAQLNKTMDPQTFAEVATAQQDLILPAGMNPAEIGTMTRARWSELYHQLRDLNVIEGPEFDPDSCWVDMH